MQCGAVGLTLLVASFTPPAPGGKPAHDPACFKAESPFYVVSLLSSQTINALFQLHLSKNKRRMLRQYLLYFMTELFLPHTELLK